MISTWRVQTDYQVFVVTMFSAWRVQTDYQEFAVTIVVFTSKHSYLNWSLSENIKILEMVRKLRKFSKTKEN
jgi:hypothetical protein